MTFKIRYHLPIVCSIMLFSVMGCGKVGSPGTENEVPTQKVEKQAEQATQQSLELKQYPSAARVVLDSNRQVATKAEMDSIVKAIQDYFEHQPLEKTLQNGRNGMGAEVAPLRPDSPITMFYHTSAPEKADEVPLVAIGLGLGANAIDAHALAWQENGTWWAESYPQMSTDLQLQREEVFRKSPFGAASFQALYQQGDLVAVVLEFGHTQTGQEVQLLRRENHTWKLLWAPTYDNWETLYHAKVEMQDIRKFKIHRADNTEETWQLQGERYVRVS